MNIIVEFLSSEYYEKACYLINKVYGHNDNPEHSILGRIDDNCKILCARLDDEIVGLTVMTIINRPFSSSKHLYLDYVCTDSNYRRMGIGKLLMVECEKFAKDNGCTYIKFTSSYKRKEAHAFYSSLGYSIVESAVFKKEI